MASERAGRLSGDRLRRRVVSLYSRAVLIGAILLAGLLVLPTSKASGQGIFPEDNDQALRGVDAVFAMAVVSVWNEMPGDEEKFQARLQSAFELGLRRDGVRVTIYAPAYLVCRIALSYSPAGRVTYHLSLHLYRWEANGVHQLLWDRGAVGYMGELVFNAETIAGNCVDTFSAEWLKWNPR